MVKSKSSLKKPSAEPELDPNDFASTDEEFGGFESQGSSEDESEIEEQDETSKADEFNKAEIAKLAKKALKNVDVPAGPGSEKNAGVVYVGRIPHGFFERQMKDYFGQFGDIKKLRMSRNKRTGASKHYAFIEFEHPQVADVVCDTMDNYLLFGHLLKVKRVSPENVHQSLFAGANRKFQEIPWGKVGHRRYQRKHPQEWWEEQAANAVERRKSKNAKLKSMGINYTL